MNTEMKEFYEYCLDFYGKDGIYAMNAPHSVIKQACLLVSKRTDIDFDGDTMDREMVCHILETLGYSEA